MTLTSTRAARFAAAVERLASAATEDDARAIIADAAVSARQEATLMADWRAMHGVA